MAEQSQLNVRVPKAFLERLDNWRRSQDDLPNRPEAIRRLVDLALNKGATGTRAVQRPTATQRRGRSRKP